MIIRYSCRSSFRSLLPFHSQNSRHISRPPRSIRGKRRGEPLIYIAPYVLGAQPFKSFRPGTPPAGLLPFGIRPAFVRCGPFVELFGCSAKGKAIATRAALTGCRGPARLPSALLRFRLPAVLCIFGPSGAFPGAFGLLPVHLPGCLPLRPSCVPFWPSLLPFSIRAAACCSASALPSVAAVLCLPEEVKAARLRAWSASLLCCLLWPFRGFPEYGLKPKAARLCSASLPRPKEGGGSASLRLRCFALRLSKN